MTYLSGKQVKAIASLASKDPGRFNLNCVWIDCSPNNNLRISATDGHQLFQLVLSDSYCENFEAFAYSLDTIKRFMAKDRIKVSATGLELNGQPIDSIVDRDLSMPDLDAATPEKISNSSEYQNYFGVGFGILNRVSKTVCAVGDKEQSVRFQIGSDEFAPMRYDFTAKDLDSNPMEALGVVMPVRI